MPKQIKTIIEVLAVVVLVVFSVFSYINRNQEDPGVEPSSPKEVQGIEKFATAQEFKEYIAKAGDSWNYYSGGITARTTMPMVEESLQMDFAGKGGGEIDRVSETNVQVQGIDEPDILKTNGKDIFFSTAQTFYRDEPIFYGGKRNEGETKIISTLPLEIREKIEKSGNLLLKDDILAVLTNDKVYGYDISDKAKEVWKISFNDNVYIQDVRLYQDKLYLVLRQNINIYQPCPIRPLEGLEIRCADIYHPKEIVPVNVTYTALMIDFETGSTEKKVSFVGSSDSSNLYMSTNALYVTYYYLGDFVKFQHDFLQDKASDLVPQTLLSRLEKLIDYDISDSSKMTELNTIMQAFYNSLSRDERMRIENEIQNRVTDYYDLKKRDLEKTGIVKTNLDDFSIESVGVVPGKILNQFSLDEYENNLRVAVTIGQNSWRFGGVGESVSDVYVLDKDMEIQGEVKDLGKTERIYSVRFIADKGYVVTFRQTDPFYVLDLSDPSNLELKGELKIPGYSSYLHPISSDLILGIGKQDSKVKLSLFDVSDPSNPREKEKYVLDEYYSEALNNHHAFLLDKDNELFFMPGSKGGYIFSYNQGLRLERAVSDIRAKRALYINDKLYIAGDDKIIVIDAKDLKTTDELEF